jgi:hypothetical protein
MGLFIVRHQHAAETCPAADPRMGPMLALHVSPPNAEKFGLSIQGEGVVDGGHTLYLIVHGEKEKVDEFMAPFSQMGTVEVLPASTCEQVVTRAAC